MACIASVVMEIVDCYIGSILSIGCFLLEWLMGVTCPIAHRRTGTSRQVHSFRFGRSEVVRVWSLASLVSYFIVCGARTSYPSSTLWWVVFKKLNPPKKVSAIISVLISGDIWVGYMKIYYMQVLACNGSSCIFLITIWKILLWFYSSSMHFSCN